MIRAVRAGRQAQIRPMPTSALLLSIVRNRKEKKSVGEDYTPRQNHPDEQHSLIHRFPLTGNQDKPINTKPRRRPSSAQYAGYTQLFLPVQLQRPGQGHGQDQYRQIADDANNGIGRDDGALVQAFRIVSFPVRADGETDADFDDPDGKVVAGQKDQEEVYSVYHFAVWFEDADED